MPGSKHDLSNNMQRVANDELVADGWLLIITVQ